MPDLFIAQESIPTQSNTINTTNQTHISEHVKTVQQKEHSSPSHSPFATFYEYPKGLRFQNQENNENVALLVRAHVFTMLPWLITTLFLLCVPILTPFFLQITQLPGLSIPINYVIFLLLFYYLLVGGYAFVHFLGWFYNIGLVTNKHVVDIDYAHITYKNVASTYLSEVVDIEYRQGGFIRTFFDFGDVFIQTEGIRQNLEFHAVPHPAKVADIILDMKGAFRDGK